MADLVYAVFFLHAESIDSTYPAGTQVRRTDGRSRGGDAATAGGRRQAERERTEARRQVQEDRGEKERPRGAEGDQVEGTQDRRGLQQAERV